MKSPTEEPQAMTSKKVAVLSFFDLHRRHPGITGGLAAALSEATRVCLERHHSPPAELTIDYEGSPAREVRTFWDPCDERTRRAWGNEVDATEYAAYCLALAAVEATTGLVAVGRAETGSGADYYLGIRSGDLEDFESCYRLEVSGVDRGGLAEIRSRLHMKVSQAARAGGNLPAIASVVGFAMKLIVSTEV